MKKLIDEIETLKYSKDEMAYVDSGTYSRWYTINRVVDQVLGFIQHRFKELDAPNDEGFWWKKLGDRIDCVEIVKDDGRYCYWSGTQYDGDIKRYTDEDIGFKWIKAIVPE